MTEVYCKNCKHYTTFCDCIHPSCYDKVSTKCPINGHIVKSVRREGCTCLIRNKDFDCSDFEDRRKK